jgi:DNA invertase Pin-like site-specific DNA recombinase
MQAAIGYWRVSTREQGRRGLGLAAQRFEIEALGLAKGFRLSPGTRVCRQGPEQMRCCYNRGSRHR